MKQKRINWSTVDDEFVTRAARTSIDSEDVIELQQ